MPSGAPTTRCTLFGPLLDQHEATFQPFALEEWQSRYEQTVEINLADSGVLPVTLRELLALGGDVEELLDLPLHYPEVNGTERLRRMIAAIHEVQPEHVLVTVGAAEASAIVVETLVGRDDGIVVMSPSYAQVEGIARNRGADVSTFPLDPQHGWRPNLKFLEAAVGPKTRLIAVTNPNNPTGYILSDEEVETIVDIARGTGAWLLSDEVYRGSERVRDEETPSLFDRYERAISINSLSKSYGLSGLRVGWIVADPELIERFWRRHEYAVIATSVIGMSLAEVALQPAVRESLFSRNRKLIRENVATVEAWVERHSDVVQLVPPQATALAFIHLSTGESSLEAAHRIKDMGSVLVAPGSCFGLDDHFRLSHALNPVRLSEALERIAAALRPKRVAMIERD
jgi:aspartate/methionine/tyrosine aminotransferase